MMSLKCVSSPAGDAVFVNQSNATAMQLTYVSPEGHAIIRVDNTSFVPYPDKRDTVRITTSDYFPVGTVWVIDAVHLPFGCSVSRSLIAPDDVWELNGMPPGSPTGLAELLDNGY